jgi:hypothetical protein
MERSLMPMSEPAASGDGEAVKVCNACGQEKPLTDFFGPYTDKRTGRQKWQSPCKACQSERDAARPKEPSKYELARERRLRDYPGSKVCADCGEEKPLADFGQPQRRDKAGGRIGLVFSPRCLPCQSKATMARQARRA